MWIGCGQLVEKYLYLQAVHMCIQLCPHPPVEGVAAPWQQKVWLSTYPQVSTIYYLDISPFGVIVPYGTRAPAGARRLRTTVPHVVAREGQGEEVSDASIYGCVKRHHVMP